jgi:small subunit ribosomal protein S14
MSKSITLNKEFNKRNIFVTNFINRKVYHSFLKDSRLSLSERQCIYQKLTKIRYSSSIVRFKNYCILTGHSRSVYRDVKLTRHKFNTMVLSGDLPGCI